MRPCISCIRHFQAEILSDQDQCQKKRRKEEQRGKLERGGTGDGNGCYRLVTNTDAK